MYIYHFYLCGPEYYILISRNENSYIYKIEMGRNIPWPVEKKKENDFVASFIINQSIKLFFILFFRTRGSPKELGQAI